MRNTPFNPPPGLTNNDTLFASPGRWANGSLARFFQQGWQVKNGWERLTLDNLGGVCRAVLPWTDAADNLNIAFGLHNGLKVWQSSIVWDITPAAFVAGMIDGTGGRGYGTGAYGVGTYGTPSADAYFPLTWSLAFYGGELMANPRNQTIFTWNAITPNIAIPLANAPARVTYMVTNAQRQVMAFGCNEEIGAVFNPLCIRWSDIEDPTDWTTAANNNAGEWILESGGRIVCARVVGDYVFVWTTSSVFLGTFIGAPGQTWKFEQIGANCGSISPGAPIVKSQTVAWITPDRTFWTCVLGGAPQQVECEIRTMFNDHITQGQDDKIVGSSVSAYSELTWFWPDDRDGFECSRAITYSPDGWSRDILARTAYADTGPQPLVIGVSPDGQAFWQEKGNSADGGVLTGFIESTDFYLDQAEGGVLVNGLWPDFKNQIGQIYLTIYTREFPQSTPRAHGPWPLAPGMMKRSFRLSGRIARVRFDWSSAPAYARGGQPMFDVQAIGGR
jgi:hypothetical protein